MFRKKIYFDLIRIKPDWNVKVNTSMRALPSSFIRIKPDWNVKSSVTKYGTMFLPIRIKPDWNVKMYYIVMATHRTILE